MKHIKFLFPLLLFLFAACQPAQNQPLELARSTENFVEVVITLTRTDEQAYLSATFAPTEGKLHLYSKDLPRQGVDGLGRPALLELPADSILKASGELTASAAPQSLLADAPDLLMYPEGAITLTLPVILPEGTEWFDDHVLVTYMVCSGYNCRPPVEGKSISIRIPQRAAK
jgi:hypothetical protein